MKAVIDIGSNTVRLLVFNTAEGFEAGVTQQVITRLSQALSETGRLSPNGIAATWVAFDAFQQTIQQRGVEQVEAFATEAVRQAINGADFVAEVSRRYGWDVRIIDGEEEANIGFIGATFALETGCWTLIDIGGGSTEIIQGDDIIQYRRSFPVGAQRLTDAPSLKLDEIFTDLPAVQGKLVGIGGTITTIMAMEMQLADYQRSLIHGKILTRAVVQEWMDRFPQMSLQERLQLAGLDPKREPIIRAGMQILDYLLQRLDQTQLVVSDYGNLEGYALSRGLCKTNI